MLEPPWDSDSSDLWENWWFDAFACNDPERHNLAWQIYLAFEERRSIRLAQLRLEWLTYA